MRARTPILSALFALCLGAPAQAATFNVNSLADGTDAAPGNGICATAGGSCTLRAAIQESGTTLAPDDVVLGSGSHAVSSFVFVHNQNLTIRGAGARATTIEGASGGDGVLVLDNSQAHIHDLRITGGASTVSGGALSVGGGGSVLVERVAITNNHVTATGGPAAGGAISKNDSGSLTVRSTLISGNTVSTTHPDLTYSAYGGGIAHSGGTLTVANTTIQGNTATGIGGAGAYGGGLYTSAGTANLRHVTLAGNSVAGPSAHGGNLASDFTGQLTLENSIVAHGTAATSGANCYVALSATLTPAGRNIDTGSSCAFGSGHLSGTDPLLGPLADNGGAADTLMPAATSPAIDAAAGCPLADDQRGVTRPAGAACDIGAVERVPEPGGGPPPHDVVAPIVSDFEISARRFRIGRATRRTRSLPRATNFIFHLSEPSLVEFAFERRATGRRARNGRCVRPTRRNRHRRRCVRWLPAGSLADNLFEGTQSVRFDGDVTVRGRGRTLRAGRYRVSVVATDAAGNRSAPVGGRFRIVRP